MTDQQPTENQRIEEARRAFFAEWRGSWAEFCRMLGYTLPYPRSPEAWWAALESLREAKHL